jgi:hypothetical protein
MCFERHLWDRREKGEESSKLWQDFERTRPVADPPAPTEVSETERTEVREEVASER